MDVMEAKSGSNSISAIPNHNGQCRKVRVVYYLSRAGVLEQPHLLDVCTSSPEGLRFRDVKKKLMSIRGVSMPSSFSWSFRRRYMDGFLWQDISDDDEVIIPNHSTNHKSMDSDNLQTYSNEQYVFKGCSILSRIYTNSPNRRSFSKHLSSAQICQSSSNNSSEEADDCSTSSDSDLIISFKDRSPSRINNVINSNQSLITSCATANHQSLSKADRNIEIKLHSQPYLTFINHRDVTCNAATQTEEDDRTNQNSPVINRQRPLINHVINGLEVSPESSCNLFPAHLISPPPCSSASSDSKSTDSTTNDSLISSNRTEITPDVAEIIKSSASLALRDSPANQRRPPCTPIESCTNDQIDVINDHQKRNQKLCRSKALQKHRSHVKSISAVRAVCSSSSGFLHFVSCGGGLAVKNPTVKINRGINRQTNCSANSGLRNSCTGLRPNKSPADPKLQNSMECVYNSKLEVIVSPAERNLYEAKRVSFCDQAANRPSSTELSISDNVISRGDHCTLQMTPNRCQQLKRRSMESSTSSALQDNDYNEWRSYPVFGLDTPSNHLINLPNQPGLVPLFNSSVNQLRLSTARRSLDHGSSKP